MNLTNIKKEVISWQFFYSTKIHLFFVVVDVNCWNKGKRPTIEARRKMRHLNLTRKNNINSPWLELLLNNKDEFLLLLLQHKYNNNETNNTTKKR